MSQDQPDNPSPADPAPAPAAETAPDPAAAPTQPAAPPPPNAPRVPWRERAFRFRAVVAVGVASLVVGAGAGVVTTLLVDGHDNHHGRPGWSDQRGPGGGFGERGQGGNRNGPPSGTGQLPPAITPEESTPQESESSTDEDDDSTN